MALTYRRRTTSQPLTAALRLGLGPQVPVPALERHGIFRLMTMIVRVVSILGPVRCPRLMRSTTFFRCSRSCTRTCARASGSPARV